MVERHLRQDALAHRALRARSAEAAPDAGVRLWLEGPRTQLALRGNAASPAFVRAVESVCGAPLPAASRASRGPAADLLWMGPDEWLAVAQRERSGLAAELERALGAEPSLVSDVSHGRVVIGLAGADARRTLAKGMSIDLHPRAFGVDHVAQSALARAQAMIHLLDESPTFHVYVHRSFADYALGWLEDAAAEYGIAYR